jgi:hypothetical protein
MEQSPLDMLILSHGFKGVDLIGIIPVKICESLVLLRTKERRFLLGVIHKTTHDP